MKSVIIHGVLAFAGLVWAYEVWTAGEQEERPEAEIEVLDCEKRDFKKVRLRTKIKDVTLEMRGEGSDRHAWITVENQRDGKKQDKEQFVGSEAAIEYIDHLAPLKALRALGNVDKKTAKSIGMDDPGVLLEVSCDGKKNTVRIGGSTYGSSDRYGQLKNKGDVFLFSSDIVRDLESAKSRLMQRTLQSFQLSEVVEIDVEVADKKRTLLQLNREKSGEAQWVDSTAKGKRNELYGNWLGRVEKLQVLSYLKAGQKAGEDIEGDHPVKKIGKLVYRGERGRELSTLELVRVDSTPPDYYAKSSATRLWVKLTRSMARQVAQDARPIVGLEAEPEPEIATSPPAGFSGQSPHGGVPASPHGASSPHGAVAAPPAGVASPHGTPAAKSPAKPPATVKSVPSKPKPVVKTKPKTGGAVPPKAVKPSPVAKPPVSKTSAPAAGTAPAPQK